MKSVAKMLIMLSNSVKISVLEGGQADGSMVSGPVSAFSGEEAVRGLFPGQCYVLI